MVFYVLLGILVIALIGIIAMGIKEKDADAIGIFFGVAGIGGALLLLASVILMVIGTTFNEQHFSHTERYKIVENSPIENGNSLEVFVYDRNGVIDKVKVWAEKVTISGNSHIIIDHYDETAGWAVPWQYSSYKEVKIID